MTKLEFLGALHSRLSGLPQQEIEERLTFYNEIIQDGMDEGLSEKEAVARIGNIDDIVADIPSASFQRQPQKLSPWAIVLLVFGSPLWISLLAAAFAVVIALFASLWSAVISLWAVLVALWASSLGGLILGVVRVCIGPVWVGIAYAGMALVCAGTSLFLFYGCTAATKGAIRLTQICVKRIFKKEGSK